MNDRRPPVESWSPPGHGREAILVGLFLVTAGFLRLVYLLQYRDAIPFLHVPISDSAFYHAWAERVASGEGYGPRPYYMAPLYPTLLGLLYRVIGPRPEVAVYLQCALGVINVWLVARLGRRIVGPFAGLLGAILLTLYAPVLFLETKVLTETLTITLLLLAILAGSYALEAPSAWPRFLVAGGVIGLAALARPNLLALPVLAGLWAAIRAFRGRPIAPLRCLALAAAGLVLVVAPVTLRNLVVGHDLVLISSNGGIVFAQGNHPEATGISTILPGFPPRIEEQQEREMRIASEALGRKVTPSESSAFWLRKGLAYAIEDPAGFIALWLRKALWALHAREPRDVYNLDLEAEVIPLLRFLFMPFPVILGLALFGALRLSRPWPEGAILTWIGVGVVGATLLVFSMSFRYRAPAVPLLAPFAGGGLLTLLESLHRRHAKDVVLALACVAIPSAVSLVAYPIPPVTAEAPANVGAAFLKRGQTGPAIAWTRRALEMDPRLASANYNMGLILKDQGDLLGAIQAFYASIEARPDDPAVHNDLAVALDETGRKDEAVQEYREALRLRPEGRIAYNLALALYDIGRYEESREALRTAESLGLRPDPAFVRALDAHFAK